MTRFFDILLSFIAILILLPLFVLISLILLLTGEHAVFYLQERIGRKEKPFRVVKFVTMVRISENMKGGLVTQKNDTRVLPVGRFLRKTKINELPQLFNVFIGQMSFVGPRPQAPQHYSLYNEKQREAISKQRPGITGIGSIIFRNEEKLLENSGMDHSEFHDKVITPYKGDLEIWYSCHKSLGLYLKILFWTFIVIFFNTNKWKNGFRDIPAPPQKLDGMI
mgnify:FL=1